MSEGKLALCPCQLLATTGNHVLVHRLVAQAFIPKTEEDLELGRNLVNHLDGNPSHNWAWNLEWCTNGENMQHAVDTGLWVLPKGENRSTSKWTDDEVRIICAMMAEGHKATYIYHALLDMLKDADKVQYERVRTLYKHIIRQTHWKHIAKDYNIDYTNSSIFLYNISVLLTKFF